MTKRGVVVLLMVAMESCLAGFAQDSAPKPLTQKFVNTECHVRFSYPERWQVVAGENCTFKLQPADIKKQIEDAGGTDFYTLTVLVFEASFKEGAEKSGFTQQDGEWMLKGDEVDTAADPLTGSSYKGLIVADVPCRINNEQGGYVAIGDCAAAMVANNGRAASLRAKPEALDILPLVATSIRFDDGSPTVRSRKK